MAVHRRDVHHSGHHREVREVREAPKTPRILVRDRGGFIAALGGATTGRRTSPPPPPGAGPTQLAITTQPTGAIDGVALTTQPVLEIRDAQNQLDTSSTLLVTAAIATGTGTISAGSTKAAVAGVATFTALTLTGVSTDTIVFTASGLSSATSATIVVTGAGEPVPSGTIIFDGRAGGAQDFQSITTRAQLAAYFTATGGELTDLQVGVWNMELNYNGSNKHAMRLEWTSNPAAQSSLLGNFYFKSGGNDITYPNLYYSVVIHLGKTATGGGIGSVGSFVPVTNGGGMKRTLFARSKDNSGDPYRLYPVWNGGDQGPPNRCGFNIDTSNFDVRYNADYGVAEDVRWTMEALPGATNHLRMWRNGVAVLDHTGTGAASTTSIGTGPFAQMQVATTRFNCTQDETEYWTDLVVWSV